jgi:hypothetical protein
MQENDKGKRFLESLFSQLEREESEQQENVMANHPEFNHCDICPPLANKAKRLCPGDMCLNVHILLKGIVPRDFLPPFFFRQTDPPGTLIHGLKSFS